MSDTQRAFTALPKNRFSEVNRRIVEYEMRPGNTVSFFSEVDLTQVERVRDAAVATKPSILLVDEPFPINNNALAYRRAIAKFFTMPPPYLNIHLPSVPDPHR